MTLPNSAGANRLDPYYQNEKILPGARLVPRSSKDRKRKNLPSRSVSPSNQAAGVLFRMSQSSVIESICIGDVRVPSVMSLAGQPLPPPTRDYGFSYATRERIRPEEPIKASVSPPSSPEIDEEYDSVERTPSAGRGRSRKTSPPTPRMCISCGATKTPYWREAWSSSVLLCNACGLRYSKFRRRCLDCSYVPRKEDKGSKACTKCGGPWS